MSRPAPRGGGAAGVRLRAARYLRPHARAYALAAVIFLLVDLVASEGWWFFWPVLIWGSVVLLHYIYVKIVNIDALTSPTTSDAPEPHFLRCRRRNGARAAGFAIGIVA